MRLTLPSLCNSKNHLTFGYDKRLNRKLIQKLDNSPDSITMNTIRKVNDDCNEIEKTIIRLEGKGGAKIEENESQINFLLDYFYNAKSFLCFAVERFFPELNFINKTMDAYENEYGELFYGKDSKVIQEDGTRKVFSWRKDLVNGLMDELDELNCSEKTEMSDEPSQMLRSSKTSDSAQMLERYVANEDAPKSLDDVVGLKENIEDIKDLIVFPLKYPEEAQKRKQEYGIKIPGFSVFYGPPGCGKTMLAQAIAAQCGCDMYLLDLSKVGSCYINQSALNIAKAFNEAEKIAQKSEKPLILFMDEMDSLLTKRDLGSGENKEDDKVVNTLLPLIEQAKRKNIMIIGATNAYKHIDSAAKRRVNFEAYVGLPDEKDIIKLLEKELLKFEKGEELISDEERIKEISKILVGYSPSNIINIIEHASKHAYRAQRGILKEDFETALEKGSLEKINEDDYKITDKQNKKIGF